MTELTAYRTLALRDALAQNPDVAFLAAFYRCTSESCVEIDVKSVVFGNQAPGLNDTAIAKAIDDRHHCWSEQLPREPGELWDALVAFDTDSRQALFAHCMALSVNAVHESWNRRPRVLAHADRVAGAVELDVAAAGWSPTVDNYLGRVTKARIIQAVREAKGEQAPLRLGVRSCPRKLPISRVASPSTPKRCAGIICQTGGAQAATGSLVTFATRRDDPCSCA
jgi:ParB family transcriptional regulator, chromosome partitioning protein